MSVDGREGRREGRRQEAEGRRRKVILRMDYLLLQEGDGQIRAFGQTYIDPSRFCKALFTTYTPHPTPHTHP